MKGRSEAAKADHLRAGPKRLTACSNTSGFAVNASKKVIRASESEERCSTLPQPCVLVSFDPRIFDHLLVMSLNESAGTGRIHCDSIDWDKEVTGLHCDSQLQQVFVAQPVTVTAMDLSGRMAVQVRADSLGLSSSSGSSNFCAIAGNFNNIVLLDRSGPRVLVLNRQLSECVLTVSLNPEPLLVGSDLDSLAVFGDSVLISDNRTGRVFKLSDRSGSVTEHSTALGSPQLCQIAVDSRGRVIVSSFVNDSMTVLDSDGTVLQTLVDAQGEPFSLPLGVCVLEAASNCWWLTTAAKGYSYVAI